VTPAAISLLMVFLKRWNQEHGPGSGERGNVRSDQRREERSDESIDKPSDEHNNGTRRRAA
jgi:hypothetical protein